MMRSFALVSIALLLGVAIGTRWPKTINRVVESGSKAGEEHDGALSPDSVEPREPEEDLKHRYGSFKTVFDDCNPAEAHVSIQRRLSCNRRDLKAENYWPNIAVAEVETLRMLKEGDATGLGSYLSCDASDLTWYELNCEADRLELGTEHIEALFNFLEGKSKLFRTAKWIRKRPNRRRHRNSRWLIRSRLVNSEFRLTGPWAGVRHATENGTIILLEQRLDGTTYLSGIPVTGVPEPSRKK